MTQDAIDQQLSLLDLLGAQIRHPEQVRQGRIVGARRLDGRQQGDRLGRTAETELAVGREISGLKVFRLRGEHSLEGLGGIAELVGFVEREAEVQPDGLVPRVVRERRLVRGDGLLVPAEPHEHDAEIRSGLDVGRMRVEEAAVGGGRRLEIS